MEATEKTILLNTMPQTIIWHSYQSFNSNELLKYIHTLLRIKTDAANVTIDNYPDLFTFECEILTKDDLLNTLRHLMQTAISPLGLKFLVLKNLDRLSGKNSNILLNFLEEIPNNTYVLATSTDLKNVLKTIISRFQIRHIPPLNKAQIENYFLKYGVIRDHAAIVSSLWDGVQNLDELYNDEFKNILKMVTITLQKSLINKHFFMIQMNQILTKDNAKLIINLLKLFFYDIQKSILNLEITSTNNLKLVNAYIDRNFNYEKALLQLNIFWNNHLRNVNFSASKISLLSNLVGCYG